MQNEENLRSETYFKSTFQQFFKTLLEKSNLTYRKTLMRTNILLQC